MIVSGISGVAIYNCYLQDLGEGMTGITGSAKAGDLENFCDSVRKFASAVCGLTENSAQVYTKRRSIVLKNVHFKQKCKRYLPMFNCFKKLK